LKSAYPKGSLPSRKKHHKDTFTHRANSSFYVTVYALANLKLLAPWNWKNMAILSSACWTRIQPEIFLKVRPNPARKARPNLKLYALSNHTYFIRKKQCAISPALVSAIFDSSITAI